METFMSYKAILVFGPPGSGKGTWGKMLGEMPNFLHVSSGAMFRAMTDATELERKAISKIDAGYLVPDEMAMDIWRQHMETLVDMEVLDPVNDCVILDGLPRTWVQAEMVDTDLNISLILSLDCADRSVLLERLLKRAKTENRNDDTEETTQKRFEVYDAQTVETLSHYQAGIIYKIDVALPPHLIFKSIGDALAAGL